MLYVSFMCPHYRPICRSVWTNTVRNRIGQKVGEGEAFGTLEMGTAKWCKEHITRKGEIPITEDGRRMLEDSEIWLDKRTLHWNRHTSRKRERISDDGSFRLHHKGAITGTFTGDWYLRKGESRDKLGEWLKKATVRSEDQRRMLQAITHSFPSNAWRYKITNGKESDKCDLFKALWLAKNRFTTESDLPEQALGHLQHIHRKRENPPNTDDMDRTGTR